MNRRDLAGIIFKSLLRTICIVLTINLAGVALEVFIYGAMQARTAADVINLFLSYYVYRREEWKEVQRFFNKGGKKQ